MNSVRNPGGVARSTRAVAISRVLRWTIWAMALLLALAPVLLVRGAATVDGPAHLYNAWVAEHIASNPGSPLARAYAFDPEPGQMLLTASALRVLGPLVGWELAERLWLAVLLTGILASLAWYVRRTVAAVPLWAPLFLAWVPLGWATGWGFYDFLAGTVLFTLLLDALDTGGRARIVVLLILLYFAHLFAFAVAVGVLVLRSIDRPDLRIMAAIAAVAGAVLVVAAPGLGGGIGWDGSVLRRLVHLAFSTAVVSVSPIALLAGGLWTALLVAGAIRLPWDWRSRVGFLLLVASIVAPTRVGGGSFLVERLHLMALIALAPLLVRATMRLPRPVTGILSLVMAGALVGVGSAWSQGGRRLDEDRARVTTLLRSAGVREGNSVMAIFPHQTMKLHGIPVYFHLVERSARDVRAIVADNYQATSPVFAISWTGRHRAVTPQTLERQVAGNGGSALPMFVVHLANARLPAWAGPPLVADDRFAVTRLDEAPGAGSDARND